MSLNIRRKAASKVIFRKEEKTLRREDKIKEREGRGTIAHTSKTVVSFHLIPVKIVVKLETPYLFCVFCVYRLLSYGKPLWTVSFSTVDPRYSRCSIYKLYTASGDTGIEHKDVIIRLY